MDVGRDQRVTMVRKGLPRLYLKKEWLNFCVRGQFEIKILTVRGHSDKHNIFHMNHWKKMNLSLRSFETGNLSADNFKKYSTSMGGHLSPWYGQMILVSGYPVLTAVS